MSQQCVCMCLPKCEVYLWQAEGDGPGCHSVVGLDCKHKLVVGRRLDSHVSAEDGDGRLLDVILIQTVDWTGHDHSVWEISIILSISAGLIPSVLMHFSTGHVQDSRFKLSC